MILAIDIGGTKFSMAVFDQSKMIRRESRSTDREGGKRWVVPGAAFVHGPLLPVEVLLA